MNTEEIKEKIRQEIEKTKKQIVQYKSLTEPISPDNAIGRVSRMDAINNKSVSEAALRQAEDRLSKLQFALTKVDTDEFGICQRCKRPIPVGRILYRPESVYCVNCAR